MTGKQPKRNPRPGVDEYGRKSLHYAALIGDIGAITVHIERKGPLDDQDDNGYTALHFAAQSRNPAVTEALLIAGANPNLHDLHGNGPLWTAMMNARGDLSVVKLLMKHGADLDHMNKHGKSPRVVGMAIKNGLESLFDGM